MEKSQFFSDAFFRFLFRDLYGKIEAMMDFLYAIQERIKTDSFFWFCALAGSGLFVLQFIVSLFWGIFDDLEVESEGLDAGKLSWLSKQGLTGFLMIFGWVGLTCRKEWGFSVLAATLTASAAGLFVIFILGAIFKSAKNSGAGARFFKSRMRLVRKPRFINVFPKQALEKSPCH